MANNGLFIGFGFPVRGREQKAVQVFQEVMQFLGSQQQSGDVESFDAALLQPHGGDLDGFVLVRGERTKLDQMVTSEEFVRLTTRAQLIVENFGVVNCQLGEGIERQMGTFLSVAGELA